MYGVEMEGLLCQVPANPEWGHVAGLFVASGAFVWLHHESFLGGASKSEYAGCWTWP